MFELTLGDVHIQKVDDGTAVPDKLMFDYGKIWVETENVATGATESFSYDVDKNLPDAGVPPDLHPGNNATASTATKYFLLIDGIKGDATERGHEGWFNISGYDLDLAKLTAGALPEFSPLTVELALGSGLTELLTQTAAGTSSYGHQDRGYDSWSRAAQGVRAHARRRAYPKGG